MTLINTESIYDKFILSMRDKGMLKKIFIVIHGFFIKRRMDTKKRKIKVVYILELKNNFYN